MPRYTLNDGRTFTNYQTDSDTNDSIQKKYNIGNSSDYRYFLQHNALKLMEDARKQTSFGAKSIYTTYNDQQTSAETFKGTSTETLNPINQNMTFSGKK